MSGGAGLPVLTFHALDDSGAVTSTAPARFGQILDALRDGGFHPVTLDDWVAAGRPDVPRGFAVTFDDGLASIRLVADRLGRDGVPATVFLLADRIGGDNRWPGQPSGIPPARLLDQREVADLAAQGVRFGSHGGNHTRMDRVAPSELDRELRRSRDRVEQLTGQPCGFLAYPYGANNSAVRRAALAVYAAAFTTRLAYATGRDDPARLPRIDAFYLRSDAALRRLIAGRWQAELLARRAARAARTWVADLQGV